MADIAKLVDQLSELTVLEAADLAKALEEKWGVSAAAAVAVAGPAAGVSAGIRPSGKPDLALVRALEGGPATLDALHKRLGAPDRARRTVCCIHFSSELFGSITVGGASGAAHRCFLSGRMSEIREVFLLSKTLIMEGHSDDCHGPPRSFVFPTAV